MSVHPEAPDLGQAAQEGDATAGHGGRTVGGRYTLHTPLGSGGMGTVWRAQDELLRREVAVKEVRLPPGLARRDRELLCERTLREARAAAMLNHPSVIKVYDVVTDADRPWIVMELLEAVSVAEAVRDQGPLPPRRVAEIGLAMLGALDAAHRTGVLHRDVKPANVLLCHDGRVVLTDFGVARGPGDSQLTSTGLLLGSPQYIAPERARGKAFGPPSDLWSLGATLFAAVEGRSPFDRGDPLQTMTAVVSEPYEAPLRAENLGPVLDGLLQKDPSLRWDIARIKAGLNAVISAPAVTVASTVRNPAKGGRRPVSRLRAGQSRPGANAGGSAIRSSTQSWTASAAPREVAAPPVGTAGQGTPGTPGAPGTHDARAVQPNATMFAPQTGPTAPGATAPASQPIVTGPTGTRQVRPINDPAIPGSATRSGAMPASGTMPINRPYSVSEPTQAVPGLAGLPMTGAPDPYTTQGESPTLLQRSRVLAVTHRPWLVAAAIALVVILAVGLGTIVALTTGDDRPAAAPTQEQVPSMTTVTYTDPRGFTINVPKGWEQRGKAPSLVRFYDPDNDNAFVQVYVNSAVGSAGPAGVFQAGEKRLKRSDSGTKDYQRIRIEKTEMGGYDGAVWEFTSTNPKDGTPRHTFDFGTVRPDGKSYEFYVTGPATDAAGTKMVFESVVTSLTFNG